MDTVRDLGSGPRRLRGTMASSPAAAAPATAPARRTAARTLLRGCCAVLWRAAPGRPPKLLAAHHDLRYWAAARTLLLGGPGPTRLLGGPRLRPRPSQVGCTAAVVGHIHQAPLPHSPAVSA